jgi:hypothetical protein
VVGDVTIDGALNVTDPVVQQSDIGTDPNQIPLNQYLGSLAYQSDTIAVADTFTIGDSAVFTSNGNVGIGTASPTARLAIENNTTDVIAQIRNSSTVASISKTTGIQFIGTDTVGTSKEAGTIFLIPADNNYIGSNMLFNLRGNDTIFTRMLIDSGGNVTMPAQPSLYLDGNNSTTVSFTAGQQLLTSTYYQQRFLRGGISWNGTTGHVTVPVAGHYMVTFCGYLNAGSSGRVSISKKWSTTTTCTVGERRRNKLSGIYCFHGSE